MDIFQENVISIRPDGNFIIPNMISDTPIADEIEAKAKSLAEISSFKTEFDYNVYRKLERRNAKVPVRGGIVFKSPFKLVNSHSTCQQCLYAFEIDTYGRGCVHNCIYCYAKEQLTRHGYWNNPYPVPVDLTDIWNTFYTVFETDKRSKWRDVLEQRVPLRIGSMSDSFMKMDRGLGITKEFLRILNHYEYPHIIFTRSDSVADESYLEVLNPKLCSIQMSIASTNDEMNALIEPGTPGAKDRLKALGKLSRQGFWTTVRLNPFFPIYPDGYFSDPNFDRSQKIEPFNYSSFEMIDEIAAAGIPSVLAGFVRLSPQSLKGISEKTNFNLKSFFKKITSEGLGDYYYSPEEIRAYYERIQAKCVQNGVQFTTCYIGNNEGLFWRDQDLWTNKKDCCNVKGVLDSFKTDSRVINWETRIKHTNSKSNQPNDIEKLHQPL